MEFKTVLDDAAALVEKVNVDLERGPRDDGIRPPDEERGPP